MKRFSFLVIAAFSLLGGALWVSQNIVGNWEPQLLALIETSVGQAIHGRVSIDALSLSFFNRLSLHHVRIWENSSDAVPIIEAERVDLTVSLIDLPRALYHHSPIDSIGAIAMDTPVVRLNPSVLSRHRPSKHGASFPPVFTLSWQHGAIQWKGGGLPEGDFSMYQVNGAFRVRGPRYTIDWRSTTDWLRVLLIHGSLLGSRWNTSVSLDGGNIPALLSFWQATFKRPLLPDGWKGRGEFHLDLTAGARHWPKSTDKPWNFIHDGGLLLTDAGVDAPNGQAINLRGGLRWKDGRLEPRDLSVEVARQTLAVTGRWSPQAANAPIALSASGRNIDLGALRPLLNSSALRGNADLDVQVTGTTARPQIGFNAATRAAFWGAWPIGPVTVQIHRLDDRWTIDNALLSVLDGPVHVQGYVGDESSSLQISAQGMDLDKLRGSTILDQLGGHINVSCALTGPMNNLSGSGSFWLSDLAWGRPFNQTIQGQFEVDPTHVDVRADSQDNHFHFSAEGDRSSDSVTLNHLELKLPSGSSLTGQAAIDAQTHALSGAVDVDQLDLAGDLPFLHVLIPDLQGHVDAHGDLNGTAEKPFFKVTVESTDLAVSTQTIGFSAATLRWADSGLEVPSFHLGNTTEGSWIRPPHGAPLDRDLDLTLKNAPAEALSELGLRQSFLGGQLSGHVVLHRRQTLTGNGLFDLQAGRLGAWPVSRLDLKWSIHPDGIDVESLDIRGLEANVTFHGHANWENPQNVLESAWHLEGEGNAHSSRSRALWEAPFGLSGKLFPNESWRGDANVRSDHVFVRKTETFPLRVALAWDSGSFRWNHLQWGDELTSDGVLRNVNHHMISDASASITRAPLDIWLPRLWPEAKNPIAGLLAAQATMTGDIRHPSIHFSGQITDGRYAESHFQNNFDGTWGPDGLTPLSLHGILREGGAFAFDGQWKTPSNEWDGTLTLSQIDLAAIGRSALLPKPLAGIAGGTLAVSGTLQHPVWTGRLETGPVTYGDPANNPIFIQHLVTDVAVQSAPENADIMRLTLKQGELRTREELIRLNSGSTIDFVPRGPAALHIGAEIRNLHLGLFTLFGGLDIGGTWEIRDKGIEVQADAHTRSLFINDYELEEGNLSVDYYAGVLKLKPPKSGNSLVTGLVDFSHAPQLHFENLFVSGTESRGIQLNGDIGPSLWNFQMTGHGLDIGILSDLAGFPYSTEGQADVSLRGSGDLANPHVEGNVSVEDGHVLGLSFHTGSAKFDWQENRISFTQLSLSDPGRYTLVGAGVIPTTTKDGKTRNSQPVDFTVRLQDSNLGLLRSISSEVKQAKGSVSGLLQIKGTMDQPVLHGNLHVADGQVTNAHYFKNLRNFSLDAEFQGDSLIIHQLQGQSGDGILSVGGSIAFAGFEPRAYDLHAAVITPKGLDVQVPELAIPESPLAKRFRFLTSASHGLVQGQVTFKGPAESPTFQGTGIFSNAHFTFPPSRKNPPPPALLDWFRRITWDVILKFQDGAYFENELVEANLIGALTLKGPSDRLQVDGGMDIPEGKISYLGIDFDIREARFDLRSHDDGNAIVNTEYVRGNADSQVQAIDTVSGESSTDPTSRIDTKDTITLTVDYAPIDEIKPRLTSASNPTLSQEKLLARVTQLDAEDLSPQERNYLYQQQMVRLIDTSIATPLAKNILKRTGLVDNVRVSRVIDPSQSTLADASATGATGQQNTAANLLANTKYTVEKNVSNRLSLGYGIRFEQSTTTDLQQNRLDLINDVELSYRWFHNVYLRGSFDLPSSNPSIIPDKRVTIEPRIRFGWWGNTNKDKVKPPVPPAQ